MPNYLGHPDNYTAADPLKTPAHIVPEWYFLPFYAILRAVTFNIGPINSKLGGVLAMFGAIAVLFFVPWLDIVEGALGRLPALVQAVLLAVCHQRPLPWLAGIQAGGRLVHPRHAGVDPLLFRVFLVVMPLLGVIETPRRLPNSITEAILEKRQGITPKDRLPRLPCSARGEDCVRIMLIRVRS